MNIPILATGLSGLVGSRVQELLADRYEFSDMSRASGVDITNKEDVEKTVEASEAKTILHLAAKTDVDSCEEDKLLLEEGEAWYVNVFGTGNIVEAAKKTGKRVVLISTDFVFDGSRDSFTEDDEVNPVNWYAETKAKAESLVMESGVPCTIVRIAYPYRAEFPGKMDFVRTILGRMQKGQEIQAVTDHIFTPTFTDDIAVCLGLLLAKDFPGIYHVVGTGSLSVYDAVQLIGRVWDIQAKIVPTTREEFFAGRAFRPGKLALKNARITELGIEMKGFEEGLCELKKQMQVRKSNYGISNGQMVEDVSEVGRS